MPAGILPGLENHLFGANSAQDNFTSRIGKPTS
jgi:hypothetical protein